MRNHIKKLYAGLFKLVYAIVYWCETSLPFFKLYQPVYGAKRSDDKSVRGCEDRWKAMEPHLDGCGALLDIGCNIGYFSFMSAQKGYFALGVEADPIYFSTCQAIKSVHNVENAHFIKGWVDEAFLDTSPAVKTVINLSVFHHWVKNFGAEKAQGMMRMLASKCENMVFETGQSNEITSWADQLSFMGDDPKGWITGFLKEIGFKDVQVIGTYSTGLSDVERFMFFARK
ncbi:MAG: class I SAM-dependent methyltransferase [Alphaproteobacteria bacterium]